MSLGAMTTSDYPWNDIRPSQTPGEYAVRLIPDSANPQHRRIYWGRAWNANPALVVEYSSDDRHNDGIPSFANIEVSDHYETSTLVVELLSIDMRDIFLKVCLDIANALQNVPKIALRKACILRLERWSSFLRPSRSKMSPEVQKGLIAELHFLQRDVLTVHDESAALRGWTGPDAGPRDFAYGQVFIEVKSKRSSANHSIVVSSEEQLNVNPTEQLFLCVSELNDAPTDDDTSFTITDVVEDVRGSIQSPLQRAALDSKLANVGYFDEDDYSDDRWSEGATYYYAVIDDFPKIDTRSCRPGVSKVAYQIDLDYCGDYQVARAEVIETME